MEKLNRKKRKDFNRGERKKKGKGSLSPSKRVKKEEGVPMGEFVNRKKKEENKSPNQQNPRQEEEAIDKKTQKKRKPSRDPETIRSAE